MKPLLSAVAAIVIALLGIVVVCWLVSLIWWWVVGDISVGAVAANILPATITLFQAFKLVILLGALGLASRYDSK